MPSVYIHVPFCVRKCDYCDFFSVPLGGGRPPHERYLEALLRQLRGDAPLIGEKEISSVYFGGGTPSIMPPEFFSVALSELKSRLRLAPHAEVSAEVNPATVDASWFERVREAGVTRVSIGVQSFQPRLLSLLGRLHSAGDALEALASALKAGFESVGIDIMYSIIDESMAELGDDLKAATASGAKHISAYALTIEEGTPLANRLSFSPDRSVNSGRQSFAAGVLSEDESLGQMRAVAEALSRGGWGRYEISNFAQPGFECRHNMNYWRYGEYLGLGAGASSFVFTDEPTNQRTAFGKRFTQARDVAAYAAGTGGLAEEEMIDARTAMGEFIFMGLRAAEGISPIRFEELFGVKIGDCFAEEIKRLTSEGLLSHDGDRIKLTGRGIELSNQVFAMFV